MSQSVAVTVKDLSKKYRLFNSPRERLKEVFHPLRKQFHREFWALKDISFKVFKGQTLGIIGHNGSGKSTLLQIIVGVLKPTLGTVEVNGRISALLELGAGFNPEFSGRDNVLMNGAIMGISSEEMLARLPQIEAFAEIGEFIDQPVKIYSSGMFARLAFAAAINVDPDILIIDESLSVGDARFQNKCFQKFHEFQKRGITVIFVSQDMEVMVRHCDEVLLIDNGQMVKIGAPKDIANIYLEITFGDWGKPRQIEVIGPYNIVVCRGNYYGVPHSAGITDYNNVALDRIPGVIKGKTQEDIRVVLQDMDVKPLVMAVDKTANRGALEQFLEVIPESDNCVNRISYNPNEFRTGDKHATIVDYLLVRGNDIDPIDIKTNDRIEIYMKVIFNTSFLLPVYGFAVKTLDGIKVYGTNTIVDRVFVPPTKAGEIAVFRYTIKMNLAGGDYFITLAIAEHLNNENIHSDHRSDLIHVRILKEKEGFYGFMEMETLSEIIPQGLNSGGVFA